MLVLLLRVYARSQREVKTPTDTKPETRMKTEKLKRPTIGAINQLRIGIAMTGEIAISNATAELILVTISEIERLGGKYSLMDAARVRAFVDKNNTPEPPLTNSEK